MIAARLHRLDGLEPDNLLAFFALLGLLRALEAVDGTLRPRAAWSIDTPPLRPWLHLNREVTPEEICTTAAEGIARLAACHDFGGRKDLDFSRQDCRALLNDVAHEAGSASRGRADLMAALMTDAAIKDDRDAVDPTPLCLLFGQGKQYFLERLASVPLGSGPKRGHGRQTQEISVPDSLSEALFVPWQRHDAKTASFRWDPEEDVRYALMAGDPTDRIYKPGTQDGANRLAAVGLSILILVPTRRAGRVRPAIIGGNASAQGFTFAWPIWRDPLTPRAIQALLGHPGLHLNEDLSSLGVDHIMYCRRISVGKFLNFTRANPEWRRDTGLAE